MFQLQLPASYQLRVQTRTAGIHVAAIQSFKAIRLAEGPAVRCLDICAERRRIQESEARTDLGLVSVMPVAPQPNDEGEIFADEILVLKIQTPVSGRPVSLQIEQIGLDVVIPLLHLEVLPKFRAQRDIVPLEEHSRGIALKINPRSIGFVV